jgi:hypothetical protein
MNLLKNKKSYRNWMTCTIYVPLVCIGNGCYYSGTVTDHNRKVNFWLGHVFIE